MLDLVKKKSGGGGGCLIQALCVHQTSAKRGVGETARGALEGAPRGVVVRRRWQGGRSWWWRCGGWRVRLGR